MRHVFYIIEIHQPQITFYNLWNNKTPQPQILLSVKQIKRQLNFIIKHLEKNKAKYFY